MIDLMPRLAATLLLSAVALGCGGMAPKPPASADAGSTPDATSLDDPNRIVTFEPAGRVSSLKAYMSERDAMRNGCTPPGANLGTGVGTLLTGVASGLDASLRPDRNGNLGLALLAYASGYNRNDPTNPFDLRFFSSAWRSTTSSTSFLVFPPEMPAGMTTADEGASYKETRVQADGTISTADARFSIPIPLSNTFVHLTLAPSHFVAKLDVDARGLSIQKGMLIGYLTQTAVKAALADVDVVCGNPMPNLLCGLARKMWGPDTKLADHTEELVLNFLGDWDAKVVDGRAAECNFRPRRRLGEPTDCNAVSTCVFVNIDPVSARGPAKLK